MADKVARTGAASPEHNDTSIISSDAPKLMDDLASKIGDMAPEPKDVAQE